MRQPWTRPSRCRPPPPGVAGIGIAALVAGAGTGLITPTGLAHLAATSPPERLGQTMGAAEVGREPGDAGGPLLVGAIATINLVHLRRVAAGEGDEAAECAGGGGQWGDRLLGAWLWLRTSEIGGRRVIAFDGKTLRGARDDQPPDRRSAAPL